MRIAVNTRLLLRGKLDGIGWFTHELLSRIVKAHPEHEFHFIFDRPFDRSFLFAENVTGHVLYPPARHPLLFRLWYDLMIPRKLRRLNPDVFVSPDMMISTRTDVPQIVVLHDLNFEHYPEDLPPVIARYLRHMTPRFASKARTIVTVSEFSRQDIIEHYGVPQEKVRVVYNGVQNTIVALRPECQESSRRRWASGCRYFVFISSIHPRKNLKRLLEAFELFRLQSAEPVKLVAVGRMFWKQSELTDTLRSMRFRDDVIFTGHLETAELNEVLGGAIALMYVSYFEGFGVPIIEAFRCGVPVVTSKVTAMPEVAGNAALLIDPFSVSEISEAMSLLQRDTTLRSEMIRKGHERVLSFDWDTSAKVFWDIIEKAAH